MSNLLIFFHPHVHTNTDLFLKYLNISYDYKLNITSIISSYYEVGIYS